MVDSVGAGSGVPSVTGPAGPGVATAMSGAVCGGGASSLMARWATFQVMMAASMTAPATPIIPSRGSRSCGTPTGSRRAPSGSGEDSLKRAMAAPGSKPISSA